MNLSNTEIEQFYRMWKKLLIYVNAKHSIFPDFKEQLEEGNIPQFKIYKVRDKLWNDDSLLESFITENPENFSSEDLSIVSSWRNRRKGNFFIFKQLAKHTIFIDDSEPPHAYGVLALLSPFEEIIGPFFPVLVETVLLPFKDKIIYDGLFKTHNITFCGGIRENLKTAYRYAKEKEGIITSLDAQTMTMTAEELVKNLQDRNNSMLKNFEKYLLRSGLSLKTIEQHTKNIELFSNEYLLKLNPPQLLLDIDIEVMDFYLNKNIISFKKQKLNITSFKRFILFLYKTGRMEPHTYFDQNSFLKDFLG